MTRPFVIWSNEVEVMFRPTRTYRRLAEEVKASDVDIWGAIRRPIFAAFIIGAFTSLTTSGQLNAFLVLDGMLFWSFVPLLQLFIMASLVLVFARRRLPTARAIDLFFVGHGPWFLWLLMISGSCLFIPSSTKTSPLLNCSREIPLRTHVGYCPAASGRSRCPRQLDQTDEMAHRCERNAAVEGYVLRTHLLLNVCKFPFGPRKASSRNSTLYVGAALRGRPFVSFQKSLYSQQGAATEGRPYS